MTFSIDNPEGVATTPLRKICLGKTLRRTRVNFRLFFFSIGLSIVCQKLPMHPKLHGKKYTDWFKKKKGPSKKF